MEDQIKSLINILLDSTARWDERDDAAIDLRMHHNSRALEALTKIASDPDEDDIIIDHCAESIGELCSKMNYFNEGSFKKMTPTAQKITFGFIMAHNPRIIPEKLKSELFRKFEFKISD